MFLFSLVVGFLLGGLTVLLIQALFLLFFLDRLVRKGQPKPSDSSQGRDLDAEQSISSSYNKQGIIWVLEAEKVPKVSKELSTKVPKDQKSKKEIVEVFPIMKHAKIKDQSLILTNGDGTHVVIQLKGCTILAVSAGNLSSRKWAKRYPIKLESSKSVIYNGSKILYIYLETSWEKESWCKALRLASCTDKEKIKWFIKLNEDFHHYLASLNSDHPSFFKPSIDTGEPMEKATRIDASSSKVRVFLKKLAKKASKSGADLPTSAPSSNREDRSIGDKSRSSQDVSSASGSVKSSLAEKNTNNFVEPEPGSGHLSPFTFPSSPSHHVSTSSADVDTGSGTFHDKFSNDEGTLCSNLLLSRLFFDAHKSTEFIDFVRARIQRTLSNMRTPVYVGGITCTSLDLGNLPPYIHNMRVLPMDMNEVWAVEIDIEYSGGVVLGIETRLEVQEPDFQKGIVESGAESSSSGVATSDLLEEFEHYGNELGISGDVIDRKEKVDDKDIDGAKITKSASLSSTYVSRWKSILNSIANQVSQVPLSLAIRVTSLRGTLRVHIKPPPSDRLWVGFTSMPNIDWDLGSSVGEHKITNAKIALLISNRFKAAIRETLVLPNSECIWIPWMLAEKDDWVPRKVAPYIRGRNETSESMGHDTSNHQSGGAKTKLETTKESKHGSRNYQDENTRESMASVMIPRSKSLADIAAPTQQDMPAASRPATQQPETKNDLEDLKVPLLQSGGSQGSSGQNRSWVARDLSDTKRSVTEEQTDDEKPKRIGRKARMLDIGKKMSEKIEEKRRNIEEKGRHIVEKMRGSDM